MTTATTIEFKRKREIGEIIGDTFKFLRRNFKQVSVLLIKTAGIPFLLLIAGTVYNSYSSMTIDFGDFSNPFAIFRSTDVILSSVIVYFFLFIYFSFLYAGILSIIKSYIKNDGVIIDDEVTTEVNAKIGAIITGGLLKYFLLVLGWMLCVIPGIIICAPLLLIFPFIIFENESPVEALKKSFQLIQVDWLMTFFALFLMILVWYVASAAFSMPIFIYTLIKTFTIVQEGSLADSNSLIDPVMIGLTVFASLIQYFLYLMIPVSSALMYYNLNERRNQSGSLEQIDRIGDNA